MDFGLLGPMGLHFSVNLGHKWRYLSARAASATKPPPPSTLGASRRNPARGTIWQGGAVRSDTADITTTTHKAHICSIPSLPPLTLGTADTPGGYCIAIARSLRWTQSSAAP